MVYDTGQLYLPGAFGPGLGEDQEGVLHCIQGIARTQNKVVYKGAALSKLTVFSIASLDK